MADFSWDAQLNKWRGDCPRCGSRGFFEILKAVQYSDDNVDILACPAAHMFVVEYRGSDRGRYRSNYPVAWFGAVPEWVPKEFQNCYEEMLQAQARSMCRSVVALCSIMLDADVNLRIKNPGDRKKALGTRLEILQKQGAIDPDEFSDATLTRLGRNEVIHPKDIAKHVTQEEAREVLRATVSYLERRYKWRSSKALPSPETEESSGKGAAD